MAQANYTPIQLYRSTTASAVPTSGNLADGELAINTNDGKLYYKDSGGIVQLIASKAGASGDVVGPASATDNAIVRFDGTTGKVVQNSVVTIADSTGDISGVGQLNATTVDATNVEVTNVKAKDGTAAATIADSTGVVTVTAAPVMTALTASQAVFTTAGKALTSNAITGTGNVVMSASPTLTGTISAAAATLSGNLTLSGGTANGVLYLDGSKVLTSGSALTFDGNTFAVGTAASVQINSANYVGAPSFGVRYNASNARLGINIGNANGFPYIGYNTNNKNSSDTPTYDLTQAATQYRMDGGQFIWNRADSGTAGTDISWSELMRLTSTGLGIGTSSPGATLHVAGASGSVLIQPTNVASALLNMRHGSVATNNYLRVDSNSTTTFGTAGTDKAYLDSSGNLGLGVTPSAWNTGYKAFVAGGTNSNDQVGGIASGSGITIVSTNYYRSSTPDDVYAGTGYAMQYRQTSGQHQWFTAASGTAGNAISFSQVMTLDASGNLGVGTTSPGARLHASQTAGGAAVVTAYLQNPDNNTNTEVRLAFGPNDAALSSNRYAWVGCINTGSVNATALTFATGPGGTAPTERARITSGGKLLVGTTTAGGTLTVDAVDAISTSSATTYAITCGNDSETAVAFGSDATDSYIQSFGSRNLKLNEIGNAVYIKPAYDNTTATAANVVVESTGYLKRSTSSLRYKTDVQDAAHGLSEVMQLRPVTYKGINDGDKVFGGLIAEEVHAAGLTEFVAYNDADEPDALHYGNMVALLTKAIQEQQALIESLTSRVAQLEGTQP